MPIALLVISIACFAVAIWLLFVRETIAPAASLLGLIAIYFSHLVPLAPAMLISWVAITVIIMGISLMQNPALMAQTSGMGYMTGGAIVGVALGLALCSGLLSLTLSYSAIILAVAAGIFFALMLYVRTPDGSKIQFPSKGFFSYLAAKGFPLALTVIQPAIPLMLWIFTS